MNISAFLTPKREVVWVSAEGTIEQALERMKPNGFGSVPILDEEGAYVGTLSTSDLIWHLIDAEGAWREVASATPLLAVRRARHDTALEVTAGIPKLLLHIARQPFVSVVERGLFIGIVRRRPIIEHYTPFALRWPFPDTPRPAL